MKFRKWLIKKLIGNTPIIMNVTLRLDDAILGAEADGIFEKCNIEYSERLIREVNGNEVKNRNAQ